MKKQGITSKKPETTVAAASEGLFLELQTLTPKIAEGLSLNKYEDLRRYQQVLKEIVNKKFENDFSIDAIALNTAQNIFEGQYLALEGILQNNSDSSTPEEIIQSYDLFLSSKDERHLVSTQHRFSCLAAKVLLGKADPLQIRKMALSRTIDACLASWATGLEMLYNEMQIYNPLS